MNSYLFLSNARVFASFDLLRGFWQFPVDEDSSYHWSFVSHNGQFKFNRVVMGGKNSAAHFQKVMHGGWRDELQKGSGLHR